MNFLSSNSSQSKEVQQETSQQETRPSASSASSSSSSYTDALDFWQRRIYSMQSQRCSPAMRAQFQQQREEKQKRKKRLEASCKSARRLETVNYLSSASNMCTLQTFSAPQTMASASRRKEVFEESAPKSMQRAQKIQQSARRRRAVETASANMFCNDNDSEDEDLNELTSELFNDMQATTVAPCGLLSSLGQFRQMSASERAQATSTMGSELSALLTQLEVEPKEESELSAKFALFETFLQTVTVIREQTFEFWRENMDLFEGGTRLSAQKEVDNIDSADCMGIYDESRKWFVYEMTKKANENSSKIAQTLSLLRSRLEQINNMEVGECPFCLEDLAPLKEAKQTTVLACCHRVCTPCWEQWQRVKGSQVFCPLCRNDDFVEEVLSSPFADVEH